MKMIRRHFIKQLLFALSAIVSIPLAKASAVKRTLPSQDLRFVSKELKLVRRAEWANVLPKTWLLRAAGKFTRMTVHHSATNLAPDASHADIVECMESIRTAHIDRGFADIGYHFAIDNEGRVWEGRSLSYEGAHVAEANPNNLGVVLLGNFEEQNPTESQLTTLDSLVKLLEVKYKIPRTAIYGHRDLGACACPGKNLYSHVIVLKTEKKKTKKGA